MCVLGVRCQHVAAGEEEKEMALFPPNYLTAQERKKGPEATGGKEYKKDGN